MKNKKEDENLIKEESNAGQDVETSETKNSEEVKDLSSDMTPANMNSSEPEEVFKEDPEDRKKVPMVPLIIMGVIVLLMIVCVIVILTTGGPYNGPSDPSSSL